MSAALIMALKDHIAGMGLSQSEAAKLLGVTQPRISDLMRGKIDLFGLDTLVNMIGAAGCAAPSLCAPSSASFTMLSSTRNNTCRYRARLRLRNIHSSK